MRVQKDPVKPHMGTPPVSRLARQQDSRNENNLEFTVRYTSTLCVFFLVLLQRRYIHL